MRRKCGLSYFNSFHNLFGFLVNCEQIFRSLFNKNVNEQSVISPTNSFTNEKLSSF